ncbi:MAG: flavodoxin family protein [Oscillospiraceae bacterium]|nr:flavodoxin family protein [Oscillospiraceae bacterium]
MNALIINCSPVRTGATAEIVRIISEALSERFQTKSICIADFDFAFCTGCRSCHRTAECVLHDDVPVIMQEFDRADLIVSVSPSYWADIPGQFKAFIDRCTPWSNTHEPHLSLRSGKKGCTVALRTGQNPQECERIIRSIEHFYGHLEIAPYGSLSLCSVEQKADVAPRKQEILAFCEQICSQIF